MHELPAALLEQMLGKREKQLRVTQVLLEKIPTRRGRHKVAGLLP